MAKAKFTSEDDELLKDLGVEVEQKQSKSLTAKQERIVAGFEEVQRFVDEHKRLPRHGEDLDIFERLYATRLDRMRALAECREVLEPIDHQGLLNVPEDSVQAKGDSLDDAALLEQLGVEAQDDDITQLRHVRSTAEKRAAEEIANREPCADFAQFSPFFDQVQKDLASGVRVSSVVRKAVGFLKTDIKTGEFFILGGQTLYVAEVGEPIEAPNGESDARLRVIYSNGTESNILLRSLQRAIYKDEASRRIGESSDGPLFSDDVSDEELASGYIYVLRSHSDHPLVAENRDLLHKIGLTGAKVEQRIANAKLEPTFLMADVEIVTTYELFNINRNKLEQLIHRVFEPARLDITINDRFNRSVTPREWFLVPLFVIDEAVSRIKDGTLAGLTYDPSAATLVKS